MKEYTTYVYKKSKNKIRKRFLYNSAIVFAILGVIYMYLIGVFGIGFSIVGAVFFIGTLIQMKLYDDKYMGITAYGDRKEKFKINEQQLIVGKIVFPFSELRNLVIYVNEYEGMPRDLLGIHHGGNNEISFNHYSKSYAFNYIIKNKQDFVNLETLVDTIAEQQNDRL